MEHPSPFLKLLSRIPLPPGWGGLNHLRHGAFANPSHERPLSFHSGRGLQSVPGVGGRRGQHHLLGSCCRLGRQDRKHTRDPGK